MKTPKKKTCPNILPCDRDVLALIIGDRNFIMVSNRPMPDTVYEFARAIGTMRNQTGMKIVVIDERTNK